MRNKLTNGNLVAGIVLLLCSACQQPGKTGECNFTAEPVQLSMTQTESGHEVSGYSAFQVPGHFVWGASVTQAEDGKYYMIYSASETGVYPFNNAWVFGSKMGLAVSDRPDGGFRQLGFFLNQDGFAEDKSSPPGMRRVPLILMSASLVTVIICIMQLR